MRQLTYNPVRKPSHDNTSEAEAYGLGDFRGWGGAVVGRNGALLAPGDRSNLGTR